jgi:hypothetical protein
MVFDPTILEGDRLSMTTLRSLPLFSPSDLAQFDSTLSELTASPDGQPLSIFFAQLSDGFNDLLSLQSEKLRASLSDLTDSLSAPVPTTPSWRPNDWRDLALVIASPNSDFVLDFLHKNSPEFYFPPHGRQLPPAIAGVLRRVCEIARSGRPELLDAAVLEWAKHALLSVDPLLEASRSAIPAIVDELRALFGELALQGNRAAKAVFLIALSLAGEFAKSQ